MAISNISNQNKAFGATSYRSQLISSKSKLLPQNSFEGSLKRVSEGLESSSHLKPQSQFFTPAKTRPFSSVLKEAVQYVNDRQVHADDKLTALSSGKEIDIHGTMIAMKEAELSLRLASTMRDKFVEAYNKIINLQI
jgi:flagellar hook-basal body complex protein FliE